MSVPQVKSQLKRRQRRPAATATTTRPRINPAKPTRPTTKPTAKWITAPALQHTPATTAIPKTPFGGVEGMEANPSVTRLCRAALNRLPYGVTPAHLLVEMAEAARNRSLGCAAFPVESQNPLHHAALAEIAQNAGAYAPHRDARIAQCLLAQSDLLMDAAEKLTRIWASEMQWE